MDRPEMERRTGKSMADIANEAAFSWTNGLKEWGTGRKRLLALQNAAQFLAEFQRVYAQTK